MARFYEQSDWLEDAFDEEKSARLEEELERARKKSRVQAIVLVVVVLVIVLVAVASCGSIAILGDGLMS